MKYLTSLFIPLICAGTLSSEALADITIRVDPAIDVLAIDGQETEKPRAYVNRSLRLADGRHQLLLRLGVEVETRGNDTEFAHSDTFVVLFEATNQQLSLSTPKIKTPAAMEAFNQSPEWQLRASSGLSWPLAVAPLRKEGFQLSRNYTHELALFNQGHNPAALAILAGPAQAYPPANSALTIGGQRPPDAATPLPLQMLQYWYQVADQNTRQKFIEWTHEK